jgi:uncharacterized phosphosugar-binding protein
MRNESVHETAEEGVKQEVKQKKEKKNENTIISVSSSDVNQLSIELGTFCTR